MRNYCFETRFIKTADSDNDYCFTKEQIQQEKETQLLYTADVKLGHLRMMKMLCKRSLQTFRVFWMYNSETEKTQMNVFNPFLGAEREDEGKEKHQ